MLKITRGWTFADKLCEEEDEEEENCNTVRSLDAMFGDSFDSIRQLHYSLHRTRRVKRLHEDSNLLLGFFIHGRINVLVSVLTCKPIRPIGPKYGGSFSHFFFNSNKKYIQFDILCIYFSGVMYNINNLSTLILYYEFMKVCGRDKKRLYYRLSIRCL